MASNNNTQSKDALIGQYLGDYRITSKIAEGGMARIYKGMDHKLQRPAAIKVLEQSRMESDATLSRRFLREARAVAGLDHENIISIYQFGEDPDKGLYFLAMKLISGKDLAAELKKLHRRNKLMEIDRALHLMTQVAAALDYAHEADIIHRDVKPSNILIDKDDKAILTDFGLVLRASAETTMGTAFGTPRYIAPEQAISSNKAVPQSDIYALAVIFYEILTGETPFNGDSPMEIALGHISDQPKPLRDINPDVPAAVEKEILKALAKEPEQRHSSATELVQAIKAGFGLQDQAASRPTAPSDNSQNGAAATSQPDATPSTLRIGHTVSTRSADEKPPPPARKGLPVLLVALLALAILVAGVFVLNGLSMVEESVSASSATTAPAATDTARGSTIVTSGTADALLIYDENSFTMINTGDYTFDTASLDFVRGSRGGGDDFSGDRISADRLPGRRCFQIIIGTDQPPVVPDACAPLREYLHSQEILLEYRSVPWRSETMTGDTIATFEVRYDDTLLAECATVPAGEASECRFAWPGGPDDAPDES